MLNIPSFLRPRKTSPANVAPPVSAVDRAISIFVDSLESAADVDYAAAWDAIQIARQHGYTRPVDIQRAYHNAQQWQM